MYFSFALQCLLNAKTLALNLVSNWENEKKKKKKLKLILIEL